MKDRTNQRIQVREQSESFRQQLKANKKFVVYSLFVHVVVFSLMFISWSSLEPTQVKALPQNVQARVLTPEELDQLTAKKRAEEQRLLDQKRAEEDKRRKANADALRRKQEAESKRKQKQAAEAEAKRKAEAERKRILAQKKEKERKEKEAQAKREKERREKEQAEERARLEEEKREREQKRKEQADKLAERLEALERAEQERKQVAERAEMARRQEAALALELEEKDRFLALIQSRVEDKWHVPPSARGLSVELRIRLLPTGELSGVNVTESSGNSAMDQSALSAVRSVRRFPVPDDSAVFEKYFRSFSMRFRPTEP